MTRIKGESKSMLSGVAASHYVTDTKCLAARFGIHGDPTRQHPRMAKDDLTGPDQRTCQLTEINENQRPKAIDQQVRFLMREAQPAATTNGTGSMHLGRFKRRAGDRWFPTCNVCEGNSPAQSDTCQVE